MDLAQAQQANVVLSAKVTYDAQVLISVATKHYCSTDTVSNTKNNNNGELPASHLSLLRHKVLAVSYFQVTSFSFGNCE